MSYTQEREQFIARMTAEGLPYVAIEKLLRCATTIQRLAELACSSETADRDRIKCPADVPNGHKAGPCLCDVYYDGNPPDKGEPRHADIPRITLQDYRAEQRAKLAVPDGWTISTQGDPRGYCLRVIPPSYAERNAGRDVHNLEAIGVPARDSRLRWS